jgi:hypothetical protein
MRERNFADVIMVGAVPAVLVFRVTRLTLTQRLSVAR